MSKLDLLALPRRYKTVVTGIVAIAMLLAGGCSRSQNPETETKSEEKTVRSWPTWFGAGQMVENEEPTDCAIADPVAVAIANASEAKAIARLARTPEDWDAVALQWTSAIAAMQSVAAASPKRLFAQKKIAEYQQNLIDARARASTNVPLPFTSFGNSFLDSQLLLFLSYTAAVGPPDVLIIGSSRAIQGIDPATLQAELAARGQPQIRIFNFGVNGATAQLVDLILREMLTPQQLPKLVIWADGVRALNSGRSDRTYQNAVASAGYQQLRAGNFPLFPERVEPVNPECLPPRGMSLSQWLEPLNPFQMGMARAFDLNDIDANGFLPRDNRFAPGTYYNKFPRVAGRYDADYQQFNLWGEQTVAFKRVTSYLRSQQIPLVFVNLPLTRDYLDGTRSRYEQEFGKFLAFQAQEQGFLLIDFARDAALQNNGYFFDPSHLNRYGAIAVAERLIAQPQIPWPQVLP